MENLKSVVTDAKISPNCLMPKFKRPKVPPIRSFPEGLIQFDKSILQKKQDVAPGEKLVYGENNGISRGDRAMEVEAVVAFERKADTKLGSKIVGDLKASEQIAQIKNADMMKVVDTRKRNVQVDNGDCLDVLYELKTRECDMTKPKRRKVSSLRDFPKNLKSYEVVDQEKDCVVESSDVKEDHVKETNDDFDEHLKVDFMSRGDLVDPVVDALSRGDELEKQGPVVTVDLEAVLQSDVVLDLDDEAVKDEETISEFECGENGKKSFSMAENVSLVETASEDAENVQWLNELHTSVVYPFRFPKRRKVSAVRDFPDALKILKAHNEASEKNLNQRAAHKLAGKNETTCDSHESSAPTEKSLSRLSRTLLTPPKEETVNFDDLEVSNCGANSTESNTLSTSEVTNSNKWIGGKEVGVKCINKSIVEDSMATPRCPNMPSQCYQSDTKTNQDKGKGKGKGKDEVLKRKQTEGSARITVVLALMAPTKRPR